MQEQSTENTISLEGLPTFEQFWASFQESKREFDRRSEEADRRSEKADRRSEEADRQIQEIRELQKETDRLIKENTLSMKETDRRLKEAERLVTKNGEQIGGLHNSFGNLAEHLVAPGITRRFNELGYHFDCVAERGLRFYEKGKIKAEIDIILENGDYIIAVEVKSSPKERDIEHHIQRLTMLRKYRQGDKRKILGAIAGAVFPKDVKEAVLSAGIYVLEQSGDTMQIDVPDGFLPAEW